MGHLLLILIIFAIGCKTVVRPWVGIVSYYLLAILGPQYIWWWNFEGLRVSLVVALCTIAGVFFKYGGNEIDSGYLKTRLNLWLFVLWLSIDISYFWGPYVSQFNYTGLSPDSLFSMTNNIFIFYYIAVLVSNDLKILRNLGFVLTAATVYLIYWANAQYLTQNWSQFSMGRLTGPTDALGAAIYRDENAFSMLFVTGIPFLYFYAFEIKARWVRYLLLCVIPFGWHAIFLTGSRGGFLGLGVVTILMAMSSSRRALLVPVLCAGLLIAFQFQGGSTMKDRSQMISDYEGDRSAEDRLTAWQGGFNMAIDHPFTGVGLGSFVTALPNYIESRHMVAHNTLIQFAGESGVGAGLAYLMIVWIFFANSRKVYSWCKDHSDNRDMPEIKLFNNASTISFTGLIVCSMFLSLNTYEIFFFLLIFNNAVSQLCLKLSDSACAGSFTANA